MSTRRRMKWGLTVAAVLSLGLWGFSIAYFVHWWPPGVDFLLTDGKLSIHPTPARYGQWKMPIIFRSPEPGDGIYYNYGLELPAFYSGLDAGGNPFKKLHIPLLWPFALAAVPAVYLWYTDRRLAACHCGQCGYDLTGNLSGTCPECGRTIPVA